MCFNCGFGRSSRSSCNRCNRLNENRGHGCNCNRWF